MMVRQTAVLDADGYATCPDCGTRMKCGSAGLMNLEKCHQTSNACKNARDKRNKDQKKKNTSLFNYFQGPKVPAVPSTITRSELIQSHRLAPAPADTVNTRPNVLNQQTKPLAHGSIIMPIFDNILDEFQHYLKNLPDSNPQAADEDKLANALVGHPEIYGDPVLQGDELWEAGLNDFLKSVLGWGTEGDIQSLIEGRKGLDHLFEFVKYFIVKRGVSEGLFQGKLTLLFKGLREM